MELKCVLLWKPLWCVITSNRLWPNCTCSWTK